jgi:Lrp/AsnC family transcriptional regulator, leucine-responsive regulatory protein
VALRIGDDSSREALDLVDRKILGVLQMNGRLSVAAIAERVGLSATPCWNRLRRLERTGVIKGYTVLLDSASLGLSVEVLVHVTLERHADFAIRKFVDALKVIPEVVECVSVSGQYDAILRVLVPDLPAFERLLMQRLAKVPGVAHFSSSFVLNRLIQRRELTLSE